MEVTLRPEQEALINHAVSEGRFVSAEDAVQKAVGLLLEQEQMISPETPEISFGEFLMRSPLYRSGTVVERADDSPTMDIF